MILFGITGIPFFQTFERFLAEVFLAWYPFVVGEVEQRTTLQDEIEIEFGYQLSASIHFVFAIIGRNGVLLEEVVVPTCFGFFQVFVGVDGFYDSKGYGIVFVLVEDMWEGDEGIWVFGAKRPQKRNKMRIARQIG